MWSISVGTSAQRQAVTQQRQSGVQSATVLFYLVHFHKLWRHRQLEKKSKQMNGRIKSNSSKRVMWASTKGQRGLLADCCFLKCVSITILQHMVTLSHTQIVITKMYIIFCASAPQFRLVCELSPGSLCCSWHQRLRVTETLVSTKSRQQYDFLLPHSP